MKQTFIIFLLFTLALCGCTGKTDYADAPVASGQMVVFSLVSGGKEVVSRSTTPGEESLHENLVERLDVFFFSPDGECLFYPAASQMSKTGATVKITIPNTTASTLFGADFNIYIVANTILSREMLAGKTYDQLIETVQGVPENFNRNPFAAQPYFLMDGMLQVDDFEQGSTNLGEVILNRAAAKIKVNITGAAIEGYTPLEASARISNYLESTTLGHEAPLYEAQQGEYKSSEYMPLWIPGAGPAHFDADPFYSYPNEWENGSGAESYLTIRVKWYKDAGGVEPKYYYYRLPVKYIVNNVTTTGLKRNHIYTFNVNIGALGGLDPEELVELMPNFEIKDWTTSHIVASLNEYDYLAVSETDVVMHDITTRSIQYVSSKPVSVEVDSVFHYTYLTSGEIRVDKILPSDPRYPSIAANQTATSIDITSPVPKNYVPLIMHFRVKNTAGLFYNVRVTQYPRQYITSEFSDKKDIDFQWYKDEGWSSFWSNNGDGRDNPPMKNFNLYTITTTSVDPADDFIIGGDMMHYEYNPTDEKTLYVTKKDPATNRMISPKFVIGSQRGITSTLTPYVSAQIRCAYYMEGPYGRGTWRIPTEAEMMLISRLQIDGNSAIKELFKPSGEAGSDRWWTARVDQQGSDTYYYSVRVTTAELVPQKYVPGATTSSVRCVRDVWRN